MAFIHGHLCHDRFGFYVFCYLNIYIYNYMDGECVCVCDPLAFYPAFKLDSPHQCNRYANLVTRQMCIYYIWQTGRREMLVGLECLKCIFCVCVCVFHLILGVRTYNCYMWMGDVFWCVCLERKVVFMKVFVCRIPDSLVIAVYLHEVEE